MGRRGSFSASLNRYVKEMEKEERVRKREIAREIKYQEKLLKEKARDRKEQARLRNYVFQKDNKSKIDDASRINGSCKDYVFYQFFALKDEFEELTLEQKKEIQPTKKKFQAEWQADNMPVMQVEEQPQDYDFKPHRKYDFSGFLIFCVWILIIWFIISGFLYLINTPDVVTEKTYPVQTNYTNQYDYDDSQYEDSYYNSSDTPYNYQNVELDEKSIKEFNKAKERYERKIAKYEKKENKKAEKQKKKLAKTEEKEQKKELKKKKKEQEELQEEHEKELKKLRKEQKRKEKENKKKDKE